MNVKAEIDHATGLLTSAGPGNLSSGMEDLSDFACRAAEIEQALETLANLAGKGTRRSVQRLQDELAGFEPCVTVLGQVKSGKTTLLNAMAGWADLLPSDVNPWTSVVTSLHLTPGQKRAENGAKFQFMTEDEWDRLTSKGGRLGELAGRAGADSELQKIQHQLETMREKSRKRLGRKFELLMGQEHEYSYFDKNLLERYICLGDDFGDDSDDPADDGQGQFADITRSADLYLNCRTIPHRICLRDTPGVNDTFMMREMITIKAVRDSRICVVVLSAAQALTTVDLALIRLISNLPSRDVVIFVNRIDELSDPVNQIPEIEDSIRETLQAHDGPAEAEIIFGSAYWANKALSGKLDDMPDVSADALLAITNDLLGTTRIDRQPADQIWDMSGLPALMQVLSQRIVDGLGTPLLEKLASSAVSIATSQQAAQSVMIEAGDHGANLSGYDLRKEFEQIAQTHLDGFSSEIDEIIADFHLRADRAHENFVERSTHSLLTHLERFGPDLVWEYTPTGLRVLLRSAYSSMGARIRKAAEQRYEAAVTDTAHLLYRGFGKMVEGIQIGVPAVPDIPAPVALGQTIALDFNDSWWVMWWRKTRGYKAFAKQFRELIRAETEDFMTQMKDAQTGDIRTAVLKELQGFLDQQHDVLTDLISGRQHGENIETLFQAPAGQDCHGSLDTAIETFRRYTS
ncbi:dynamin family protein [uncultured Roseovarius sp.]|uniref:dynamin family protein n=1 Tax=uncultured Roseovarius sp. TaxID=293344 RepID=UPI0025998ADE|nr:dynamin family protein [uncultured Roseovarius sp.]